MTSSEDFNLATDRKQSLGPGALSRQPRPSNMSRQDSTSENAQLQQQQNMMTRRMSVSPMRRMSMWMRRPSVASSHRIALRDTPPKVQYENTFRMAPSTDEQFHASRVESIIDDVMRSYLDGESYDARKCAHMALHLSDLIKGRIKDDLSLPRYKLVCTVVIGEASGQSVRCASRCVWHPETDGYASASFKNNTIFATATVFAAYFE